MDTSEKFEAFIRAFMSHHLKTGDIPEFHKRWISMIDERRVVIVAPRYFGKSIYWSRFYPLFAALEKPGINEIMFVSASEPLAAKWLGEIKKELETNQLLIDVFGDQRSKTWTKTHIKLEKTGVEIYAKGAGCQIRGLHPDIICLDDLEDEADAWSDLGRAKVENWFYKTLLGTISEREQLIIVGTIVHDQSLLNKLLHNPPEGWNTLEDRAFKDDAMTIPTWPERWPKDVLDRKKFLNSDAFMQEFMNQAVSDEKRPFKSDSIRYFKSLPQSINYYTAVDFAVSTDIRKDPDYTAVVTAAFDPAGNIYVEDYTHRRMNPDEAIDSVLEHFDKYHARTIAFETNGFQKALKFYFDKECKRRKVYPYVQCINNFGKKELRVRRLQPYFDRGSMFLRENQSELVAELMSFPTGKHDDILDALSMVVEIGRSAAVAQQSQELLPKGTFGEWWNNRKKKERLRVIGGQTWGNHKLGRF